MSASFRTNSLYLEQILDPKRNNFTLLRLLAALLVVVSHAVMLRTGNKSDEIFFGVSFYNLGDHAVNVFFVLSGLTVAASLDRANNVIRFLIARVLRIFPALLVGAGLLIILGIIVSNCSPTQYLADSRVLKFGLKIMLSSGSAELPGVFANNPHPDVVNAPLWTLKYEMLCYVLLSLIGFLGLLTKPNMARLLPVSWLIAGGFLLYRYGGYPDRIEQLARFWICFSFGIGLFAFHDRVKLSSTIAAVFAVLLLLVLGTGLERIVAPLATGYVAVWLGCVPVGVLRKFTNKVDLSYGVYIFGWPISQTLVFAVPGIGTLQLIALSIVCSAVLALFSWHLVEKPSLRLRRPVSDFVLRHVATKPSHML